MRRLTFGFRREMMAGVLACFAVAAGVLGLVNLLPGVSAMLVAILLGVVFRNVVGVPRRFEAGVTYTSKTVLRAGIILLGFQLAVGDILSLGWGVAAMVVLIVTVGVAGTYYLGRLLKLNRSQSLLVASGFSICGAAAVAAASDVVEAEEEDTLTSIALVVVFGTSMIPLVPFLAGVLGLSDHTAGLWTGGGVHEVAQVVAIGGMLGGTALSVAVLVKLARVLMLAPVMTVLSWSTRRAQDMQSRPKSKRPPLVPVFVTAFLIAVALRSMGIVPALVLDGSQWLQAFFLTAAMFGLGCGVKASYFRSIGVRPVILASASTVIVVAVAFFGALVFA